MSDPIMCSVDRVYLFTGLDYWIGILDWTIELKFFSFMHFDQVLVLVVLYYQ